MRLPRKRWWLLAGVVVAIVALVFFLTRPVPLAERVRRIQPGMTKAEVEKVLGAPPGVHERYGWTEIFDPSSAGPEWSHWRWDEGHVGVRFDPAGRADEIFFKPHPPISFYDRLRWRLERLAYSFRSLWNETPRNETERPDCEGFWKKAWWPTEMKRSLGPTILLIFWLGFHVKRSEPMPEIPVETGGESPVETRIGAAVVVLATFLGICSVKSGNIAQ
jgi:hypothetical protein